MWIFSCHVWNFVDDFTHRVSPPDFCPVSYNIFVQYPNLTSLLLSVWLSHNWRKNLDAVTNYQTDVPAERVSQISRSLVPVLLPAYACMLAWLPHQPVLHKNVVRPGHAHENCVIKLSMQGNREKTKGWAEQLFLDTGMDIFYDCSIKDNHIQ